MLRIHRFGMIAALTVATVAAPAFAGNVTVGRFYTEIAKAKRLVSSDAASAEANLRGAGFDLPKLALDKGLTEGDMTSISTTLGLSVKTARPSQPINESQMNTYMASFGSQLGVPMVNIGDPTKVDPFTVDGRKKGGKGKKKGHHRSDSRPI